MKVRDVLSSKGHRVETVRSDWPLHRILEFLDERNISSVVVVHSSGKPLGIVTDRIVIRALARRGAGALNLRAADVMDQPAPVCSPEDTLQEVLQVMTDERVRHLLVTSASGDVAGLVSIGDIVKFRLRDSELETRVLRELAYGRMADA
jgi:CBS domain-containing protein